MSNVDAAWAAGVYEGEGSLVYNKRTRATYNLTIKMTDLDVLNKFQSIFNVGSIKPVLSPHQLSKPHWKPAWVFSVCNKRDITHVLEAILPYLCTRRAFAVLNCFDRFDYI